MSSLTFRCLLLLFLLLFGHVPVLCFLAGAKWPVVFFFEKLEGLSFRKKNTEP